MWHTLPVPWFGNSSQKVEVATVGLNPSWKEFETEDRILRPPKERLPALTDFGATHRFEITDMQAQLAAEARSKYFTGVERKPNPFFNALQGVIAATKSNWRYDKGTAVHLDIVANATRPVWSQLGFDAQQILVSKCFPKFTGTLSQIPSEAWLMLDGRTAFDSVSSGCNAESLESTIGENPPLTVWRGCLSPAFGNRVFLGWSMPVNQQIKQKNNQFPLIEWLRSQVNTQQVSPY
ncbi:MAG TPA: hypothetical protein VGN61_01435 [Verrucomicrobiae bacterium]|jgi:hypothetical protein